MLTDETKEYAKVLGSQLALQQVALTYGYCMKNSQSITATEAMQITEVLKLAAIDYYETLKNQYIKPQ